MTKTTQQTSPVARPRTQEASTPERLSTRRRSTHETADSLMKSLMDRVEGRAPVQRKKIDTGYADLVEAARVLPPESERIREAATLGTSSAAGRLPHLDAIQRSFGRYDVSGIDAHTDAPAHEGARAMSAAAFTMGNHVAFAGPPTLHTAAHEAAHVVQQRAGVHLDGGVGQAGDAHERHADAVADLVVQGHSSEALLDAYTGAGEASSGGAIQRKLAWTDQQVATETGWEKSTDENAEQDILFAVFAYGRDYNAENEAASLGALQRILDACDTYLQGNASLMGPPVVVRRLRADAATEITRVTPPLITPPTTTVLTVPTPSTLVPTTTIDSPSLSAPTIAVLPSAPEPKTIAEALAARNPDEEAITKILTALGTKQKIFEQLYVLDDKSLFTLMDLDLRHAAYKVAIVNVFVLKIGMDPAWLKSLSTPNLEMVIYRVATTLTEADASTAGTILKRIEQANLTEAIAVAGKRAANGLTTLITLGRTELGVDNGRKLLRQLAFTIDEVEPLKQFFFARFSVPLSMGFVEESSGTPKEWDVAGIRRIWTVFETLPPAHIAQNPSFTALGRYEAKPGNKDIGYFDPSVNSVAVSYDATKLGQGNKKEIAELSSTARHEVGHAVDAGFKSVIDTRRSQVESGAWRDHSSDDMKFVAEQLIRGSAGVLAALPPDDLAEAIDILAAIMKDRDKSADAFDTRATGKKWYPAGFTNALTRLSLRNDKAVEAVRVGLSQPWWRDDGGIVVGMRIYQESYEKYWTSYIPSARATRVSNYQFRAPAEWFAEAYSYYYANGNAVTPPDEDQPRARPVPLPDYGTSSQTPRNVEQPPQPPPNALGQKDAGLKQWFDAEIATLEGQRAASF